MSDIPLKVLSSSLPLLLVLLGACTDARPPASSDRSPSASTSSAAAQTGNVVGSPFSLTLTPQTPNRRSMLGLATVGFDLGQANVQWFLNGSPASQASGAQFNCSQSPKGSTVQAVAVIQGREVRSNEVTIGNTPPELSDVALVPVSIGKEKTLAISAKSFDVDGDAVVIQCSWTVNGALAGNGQTLNRPLKRDDRVHVEVAAHDGTAYSERVVLEHIVSNNPPFFVEHQDYSYTGNTFVYQAQATDPDGDRISYSLEAPPAGMIIDQNTGRVTWTIPGEFRGDQTIAIVANDGHGGSARYSVTFTIRE